MGYDPFAPNQRIDLLKLFLNLLHPLPPFQIISHPDTLYARPVELIAQSHVQFSSSLAMIFPTSPHKKLPTTAAI
jgi:hypothetical protein